LLLHRKKSSASLPRGPIHIRGTACCQKRPTRKLVLCMEGKREIIGYGIPSIQEEVPEGRLSLARKEKKRTPQC